MSEQLNTPGKRIRSLYQDLGINQVELAHRVRALGVELSNAYVSELVNTEKYPSAKIAKGIATVLDTTLDYIYCFSDNPLPAARWSTEYKADLREDQVLYEVADHAERRLIQRMLKVWDYLSDAERTIIIDLAEALRSLHTPSKAEENGAH